MEPKIKYNIVGRVIDEAFNGMAEEIVGYFVVDAAGVTHFVGKEKLNKLVKEDKIYGVSEEQARNTSDVMDYVSKRLGAMPCFTLTQASEIQEKRTPKGLYVVDVQAGKVTVRDSSDEDIEYNYDTTVFESEVKEGKIQLANVYVDSKGVQINNKIAVVSIVVGTGGISGYNFMTSMGQKYVEKNAVENYIKTNKLELFNAQLQGDGTLKIFSETVPCVDAKGQVVSKAEMKKMITNPSAPALTKSTGEPVKNPSSAEETFGFSAKRGATDWGTSDETHTGEKGQVRDSFTVFTRNPKKHKRALAQKDVIHGLITDAEHCPVALVAKKDCIVVSANTPEKCPFHIDKAVIKGLSDGFTVAHIAGQNIWVESNIEYISYFTPLRKTRCLIGTLSVDSLDVFMYHNLSNHGLFSKFHASTLVIRSDTPVKMSGEQFYLLGGGGIGFDNIVVKYNNVYQSLLKMYKEIGMEYYKGMVSCLPPLIYVK